jgi:hypothetical protein
MRHHADVLNPKAVKRPRIRRPRVLQVVIGPGDRRRPSGRRNPHGWRFPNEARRRIAKRKAMYMLVLRAGGYRTGAIAQMFGTTTTAVYQQLYRLRSGFYDRPLARKGPPPNLRLQFVYEAEPERHGP